MSWPCRWNYATDFSLLFWETSHDKLLSGYVRARKEAEETVTKHPTHCKGLLNHFLLVCPEMAPLETTERNMHVRPREPPTSAQCPGDRREHVYVHVHVCVLHLMPKANKNFLGEFRLLLFHCDGHRCLGYLLEATRRILPHISLEMWVGVLCA